MVPDAESGFKMNKKPPTFELLFKEYQEIDIPVEKVTPKYLGITSATEAKRKARKGELPFPVFRVPTRKSLWLVRITDLADYLDRIREEPIDFSEDDEEKTCSS